MLRRSLLVVTMAVSLGGGALLSACGSNGGGEGDVTLSAAGQRGKVIATEQGCSSCHTTNGKRSTGPTWKGLAGSTVTLDDGTEVPADDVYLREAILLSRGQVVEGYRNIMPVYDGELSEAEVADLLAYLQDLAPAPSSAPPEGEGDGSGS